MSKYQINNVAIWNTIKACMEKIQISAFASRNEGKRNEGKKSDSTYTKYALVGNLSTRNMVSEMRQVFPENLHNPPKKSLKVFLNRKWRKLPTHASRTEAQIGRTWEVRLRATCPKKTACPSSHLMYSGHNTKIHTLERKTLHGKIKWEKLTSAKHDSDMKKTPPQPLWQKYPKLLLCSIWRHGVSFLNFHSVTFRSIVPHFQLISKKLLISFVHTEQRPRKLPADPKQSFIVIVT